jgi:hypothetical protein
MIGGLTAQQIAQLQSGTRNPGLLQQPAQQPIQQSPTPIQSAMPSSVGSVPLILAKLLAAKQAQAQQPQTPQGPVDWRNQPMYLGGTAGQTYNSMGGDWRKQPAFLPVDNKNPGGKFTLADPLGGLLHAVGLRGIGPAEWGNRGFFGLGF